MSQFIHPMVHVPHEPLRIEREFVEGREIIVIEGVRYDADYFRQFSKPETDVLYAVAREEDYVRLTVIQSLEAAETFFEEVKSNA